MSFIKLVNSLKLKMRKECNFKPLNEYDNNKKLFMRRALNFSYSIFFIIQKSYYIDEILYIEKKIQI